MRTALFSISLAVLGATTALAQAPLNLFGVISAIDGSTLRADVDGKARTFTLTPETLVLRNRQVALTDIRENDFVASAAIRAPDGKLHSTELRVFPEPLRGVGEGQRPMNDARSQTMTNATVTGTAVKDGSNNIKVKFSGGESELVLDPGVPVTRIEQVDRSALQPGQAVRLQGAEGGDAPRITRITIQ